MVYITALPRHLLPGLLLLIGGVFFQLAFAHGLCSLTQSLSLTSSLCTFFYLFKIRFWHRLKNYTWPFGALRIRVCSDWAGRFPQKRRSRGYHP